MKGIKWNYDTCYEEAKKYKTRSEFSKGCGRAYDAARRNKWLDDYIWFVDEKKRASLSRTKWNKETCYEEAKKYKTIREFQKGNSQAYRVSKKNKWISNYIWFEKRQKPRN